MASRLEHLTDWEELARKANFSASELASLCHVSLRQLERYWKKAYENRPQPWLNARRISAAQELLRDGLAIKEVAYHLGFKQGSHFCREFKRYTGATPGAYVKTRQVQRTQPAVVT